MNAQLKEGVTLGIAVLGATLGIVNAWWAFSRQRVKLRVQPFVCFADEDGFKSTPSRYPKSDVPEYVRIDVLNLSEFEVSVDEVGLLFKDGDRVIPPFHKIDGVEPKLPVRLKSRSKVSCVFEISQVTSRPKGIELGRPFARTDCGHTATGMSDSYRQLFSSAI